MRRMRSIILILVIMALSGCSKKNEYRLGESDFLAEEDYNPFEAGNKDNNDSGSTETVGSISHYVADFMKNESAERIVIYQGGEIELNYWLQSTGIGRKCGFLIYINGIPQPYKIKNLAMEYQYIHPLEVEEGEEFEFTFLFTPVTGKKDELLSMAVVSMINPSFSPDMIETTNYGYTHGILASFYSLKFEQDAEGGLDIASIQKNALENIHISSDAMTKEDEKSFQNEILKEEPLSDKRVYSNLYIDEEGVLLASNYDVVQKQKVRIRFEMTGFPGSKFRNILYFNHQPICDLNQIYFDFELQKGYKNTLEMDIDLNVLGRSGTFYIISVPMNGEDFPDDLLLTNKTSSIYFYDSSMLGGDKKDKADRVSDKITDEPVKPVIPGETKSIRDLDGLVDVINYLGDDELFIFSDKIYLYDIKKDIIISSIDRKPNSSYTGAIRLDNGYVVIGETGDPIEKEIYSLITGKTEIVPGNNLGCTFYNEALTEVGTVDIVNDIGLEVMPGPSQVSVSKDGNKIACISKQSLYVYDRVKKETKLIADASKEKNSAGQDALFTNISFIDNDHIFFLAHSFDEADEVFNAYGTVNTDGSGFHLYRGGSLDTFITYDDITLMSQRDSMKALSGEVFVYQHNKKDATRLKLSEKAESEHVWGSNTGKYFATSVRMKNQGWKIRVYDMMTGACVREKMYEDAEVDLYKDPYIYILDHNKSLLLLFRTASSSRTDKLQMDGF